MNCHFRTTYSINTDIALRGIICWLIGSSVLSFLWKNKQIWLTSHCSLLSLRLSISRHFAVTNINHAWSMEKKETLLSLTVVSHAGCFFMKTHGTFDQQPQKDRNETKSFLHSLNQIALTQYLTHNSLSDAYFLSPWLFQWSWRGWRRWRRSGSGTGQPTWTRCRGTWNRKFSVNV